MPRTATGTTLAQCIAERAPTARLIPIDQADAITVPLKVKSYTHADCAYTENGNFVATHPPVYHVAKGEAPPLRASFP